MLTTPPLKHALFLRIVLKNRAVDRLKVKSEPPLLPILHLLRIVTQIKTHKAGAHKV